MISIDNIADSIEKFIISIFTHNDRVRRMLSMTSLYDIEICYQWVTPVTINAINVNVN